MLFLKRFDGAETGISGLEFHVTRLASRNNAIKITNHFNSPIIQLLFKVSPASLNLNFDATITGTDQEHHGHPGWFGSTKEPSTTSKTTQTTKSPGIQNDEFDSPAFEDDYEVIPASGDKNPFHSRPHNGHKSG